MVPPKAFISYSHDSAEHKQWVLAFATTLRNRGIDAILDQWDLKPGDDLPQFMEQNLEDADFAIMICTRRYVQKANAGVGGVGYEKMIMTSQSLSKISENKVIPVVREKCNNPVPTFLKSKLYIDFSNEEEIEFSLDELLRTLLKSPLYIKPKIGKNPFKPLQNATTKRKADGVMAVMQHVSNTFNRSISEDVLINSLYVNLPMKRIVFDKYFKEAEDLGLVYKHIIFIRLTEKGREYIINNEL